MAPQVWTRDGVQSLQLPLKWRYLGQATIETVNLAVQGQCPGTTISKAQHGKRKQGFAAIYQPLPFQA